LNKAWTDSEPVEEKKAFGVEPGKDLERLGNQMRPNGDAATRTAPQKGGVGGGSCTKRAKKGTWSRNIK